MENKMFKSVALGGRRKQSIIERRPMQDIIALEDSNTDAQKEQEEVSKWFCTEESLNIHEGTYPLISSYNFVVQSQRHINPNLSVYFIGLNTGANTRACSLNFQSPPCFVKFIPSHIENEGTSAG